MPVMLAAHRRQFESRLSHFYPSSLLRQWEVSTSWRMYLGPSHSWQTRIGFRASGFSLAPAVVAIWGRKP